MQHIPNQAVPRAAAADAPPDADVLERGARPAEAILGPSAPTEPTLAARLLTPSMTYGPRAALAACLVGVVWLVGSHFVGSPPAVVRQESLQTAGMDHAAQKIA